MHAPDTHSTSTARPGLSSSASESAPGVIPARGNRRASSDERPKALSPGRGSPNTRGPATAQSSWFPSAFASVLTVPGSIRQCGLMIRTSGPRVFDRPWFTAAPKPRLRRLRMRWQFAPRLVANPSLPSDDRLSTTATSQAPGMLAKRASRLARSCAPLFQLTTTTDTSGFIPPASMTCFARVPRP